MASWELSKENIQPLKNGRKASSFEEHDPKKILKEQQEFELALRTYSGPDPLDPWYKYIAWVEQMFPKGGKEGNLQQLLEKCIKVFKDDPVNSQDERYLQVWIKYANASQAPLDNYKFMAAENICTSRPNFYINWAWELESAGNFKAAEKVFCRGLTVIQNEEHLHFLDMKHKQFQARVMKRMLESQDSDGDTGNATQQAAEAEERRTILASLKGHGKHQKVGSIRVGAVVKADGPGTLPTLSGEKKNNVASGKGFAVFRDDENTATADPFPNRTSSSRASIPNQKERNRENDLEPGKWTQARVGKKSHAIPLDKISSKATFTVHVDEETSSSAPSLTTPFKLSSTKALTARKHVEEQDNIAVALFEPPNPMVKPMYCKHLVYQGVTEFSFEELRAIKYRRHRAEEDLKKLDEEKQRWREEQAELLRKQSEDLERQKLEMARDLEQQKSEMQKFMEEAQRKQKEEFAQWLQGPILQTFFCSC